MKIGLFTDTYFPQINGVGTSVHTLTEALTKLGHEVYIFTPSDPRQSEDREEHVLRIPSMPCIFVRQFRMGLVYSPKELSKIANLHLDIIHTQTEFSLGLFGKILSKTLKIPMVHTYHTMYEDYVHYIVNGALITPAMAKDFSRMFCNHANAVIAPTEKVHEFLLSYGVVRPIHIIPTGLDIQKFRRNNYTEEQLAQLRISLGLPAQAPVILSLGRLGREKSIDVILKAMPALLARLPEAILFIVGDGPARGELEALAHSLQIEEHVLFAGAKPWQEIGQYYQMGTVFVSASVTETQGLTFIEAMAAGLPVVAKQDESIESVVEDQKTGFLFSSDETLSDKLFTLLTDADMRASISEQALIKAESMSAEAFGKSVEALYQEILENPVCYEFPKHALFSSSISMGRRAVKRLEQMNEELGNGIKTKSRAFVRRVKIPAKIALKKYKKRIKASVYKGEDIE